MEDKFQREVLDRLVRLETKIDLQDYKTISEKVEDALNQTNKNAKDIEELKEKNKYLSRTIITAIISGLIGIVFIFIKMGIGVKG